MNSLQNHIARIEKQILGMILLKSLLIGLSLFGLILSFGISMFWALFFGILFAFASLYILNGFANHRKAAISHLHQHVKGLEFSLELLSKTELNVAEQLQLARVEKQVAAQPAGLDFRKVAPFFLLLLIPLISFGVSLLIPEKENAELLRERENLIFLPDSLSEETVVLESISLKITPPSYSGIPESTQNSLQVSALKGSRLSWEIQFSVLDLQVFLFNSLGDSLAFERNVDQFNLADQLNASGIYAIQAYRDDVKVYESAFFKIEAIEDLAPIIVPTEKELYAYHFHQDGSNKKVEAELSDDFLVREVYLVATLARGSGENVKFRETRIPIGKKNFKSAQLAVNLDLEALDFKPGDELYYYWAAIDNKRPEANLSRSDTYFLNFVDSTGMNEEQLMGMAIHVMPDYFRSQRQIIIDTEKLITSKKSIAERAFNVTSNEIGYDQKLLRLRYGQYLGEEFENSAGGAQPEEGDPEDLLAGFRHDHDHEDEGEGLAKQTPAVEQEEAHESHEHDDDGGLSGILDSYIHNHEDEEMNTFYEASTKNMLKMALEQMWSSELYLRLFEPEKALPFQQKALEYLKTVQQKSRVYVKRTGYDPPPIKEEEKRLSGELEKLESVIRKEQIAREKEIAPLVAEVLGLLPKAELSDEEIRKIQQLGQLWTERMQYSGLSDWSVLLHLQELSTGIITDEGLSELYQKLHPLLATNQQLDASFLAKKELQKAFWAKFN
ncbi:hypothetical protein ACFOSV_16345 [Algoriphagus namhaensis]|uniref:Tryptophan-rich sensory protein n=1 Tax=Algoriphagus namhaensis TaxID=915353 RepID=A0ABV8AW28_9BACT